MEEQPAQSSNGSRLWRIIWYGILIYFTILVLLFTIARYIYKVIKVAAGLPASLSRSPSVTSLPSLEPDTISSLRRSTEWDRDLWEPRETIEPKPVLKCSTGFLVGRMSREKSLSDYSSSRIWEDDDGYRGCTPIYKSSRVFERIMEIE